MVRYSYKETAEEYAFMMYVINKLLGSDRKRLIIFG